MNNENALQIVDAEIEESRDLSPVEASGLAIAQSRATQEVQAAMVIAKKFPRDSNAAYNKIMTACKRKSLAEQAMYAYPRGGQMVTGPSIRMAEVLAQNWGNLQFGIQELENKNGESLVEAFCWDLETNVRQTKLFTVRHERHTKKGVEKLKDTRDIYEHVANQGSRRVRACILGVIPGDIVEAAVQECESTLQKAGKDEPIIDRARRMVVAFGELGVSQEMIEKRLGHKLDAIIEQELISLRKIFQSIKDGMAHRHDFFDFPKPGSDSEKAAQLNEKFGKKEEKKANTEEKTFNNTSDPSELKT
jgi:hypothetical protein